MPRRCFTIVNPAAASGRSGSRIAVLRQQLNSLGLAGEFHVTRFPEDAERLAREAACRGFSPVVAAGGDGTANAVANGVLKAGRGKEILLAFLPMGTGGDALRNLALPRSLDAAIALLRDGVPREVDAGCVELCAAESEGPRYFINSCSIGASASVAEGVNRAKADRRFRWLGSRGTFALGALSGAIAAPRYSLRLTLDGEPWFAGLATFAAASNGPYFGAGMRVAPDARVDDGRLQLVAVPALPRRSLLRYLPSLYSGRYLRIPGVHSATGLGLRAESGSGMRVPVEVDGELVGSLPVEISVSAGALRVLSPR